MKPLAATLAAHQRAINTRQTKLADIQAHIKMLMEPGNHDRVMKLAFNIGWLEEKLEQHSVEGRHVNPRNPTEDLKALRRDLDSARAECARRTKSYIDLSLQEDKLHDEIEQLKTEQIFLNQAAQSVPAHIPLMEEN